jgi:hypothetical protein
VNEGDPAAVEAEDGGTATSDVSDEVDDIVYASRPFDDPFCDPSLESCLGSQSEGRYEFPPSNGTAVSDDGFFLWTFFTATGAFVGWHAVKAAGGFAKIGGSIKGAVVGGVLEPVGAFVKDKVLSWVAELRENDVVNAVGNVGKAVGETAGDAGRAVVNAGKEVVNAGKEVVNAGKALFCKYFC